MIKKCTICEVHFDEKDLRGGICDECFDGHDCKGDRCTICLEVNGEPTVELEGVKETVEFIKRTNNYGYGSEGSPENYE